MAASTTTKPRKRRRRMSDPEAGQTIRPPESISSQSGKTGKPRPSLAITLSRALADPDLPGAVEVLRQAVAKRRDELFALL